ncbi:DNA glycosylase AlkZ-like family protein [Nocardia cyriacigeorgica]|uniref:DNA glycosylase AlkZ-like family protein n=1 Tax=Nocardia cyriacigeorgica TaxID=135487 RepID=UPI00245834D0|nr:crosslink repair DNA glycosylase YcaQ family protein [Nocardia cyriacigeorgica]
MAGTLVVDRRRWLGHRWHNHGFGDAADGWLDWLLLLGIQDGRPDGALRSLRARSVSAQIGPDEPLVTMWSVRGAPHAHRLDRLDFVTAANTPIPADSGGTARVRAVDTVAEALRAVVTGPITKSEASSAVTHRVPDELVSWCERCRAHHVPDGLFRTAGCRAQILVGSDERRGTLLYPAPAHPGERPRRPRATVLDTFFRVNGPITRPLFAEWLGVEPADIASVWQAADPVPVRVEDRRYSLPAAVVDDLLAAPAGGRARPRAGAAPPQGPPPPPRGPPPRFSPRAPPAVSPPPPAPPPSRVCDRFGFAEGSLSDANFIVKLAY